MLLGLSLLALLAGVLGCGVSAALWSEAAGNRYLVLNVVFGIIAILFSAASVAFVLLGLAATIANIITVAGGLL
jgi:hypothetical protein